MTFTRLIVSGRAARVASLGALFGALRWYSRLEHFCLTEDFNIIFKEKGKRFGTPYVITVDHYSPETRKTTGSGEDTGLWELRGMNG